MNKKFQIANGFFLIFTIVFNYISNTGILNGKTIGNVSDQYHTLITPAGYAFSIWGLIYLLMFGFVMYTARSLFKAGNHEGDRFVEQIEWWFVVSCIANCVWIVAWLYGYTGFSVLILVICLVALLKILLVALQYHQSTAQKWFINIPFQIYTGWISIALIAAAASWIKKIGWNGWEISEVSWTLILIVIASLIHLYMTWKKNAPVFAFVAVWALVAIAVSNHEENHSVYITALTAAAVLFISSSVHHFKRRLQA